MDISIFNTRKMLLIHMFSEATKNFWRLRVLITLVNIQSLLVGKRKKFNFKPKLWDFSATSEELLIDISSKTTDEEDTFICTPSSIKLSTQFIAKIFLTRKFYPSGDVAAISTKSNYYKLCTYELKYYLKIIILQLNKKPEDLWE